MDPIPYRLLGALGSPYSVKLRAVLRYRRIAHVWIQIDERHDSERVQVKAPVIPVLQFPDGGYHNDSTPLIRELERRHRERSVLPPDPAAGFLADLLEDMADEWGTKFMFHYRWFRERDQAQMSRWLAFDRLAGQGLQTIERHAAEFRDRQVGRMAIVGCTPENQPLIEGTLREVLAILERTLPDSPYLFGTRPSTAEFAWLGQLSQLIVDPTPNDLMREVAPYTTRWLMGLDDASGVEGDWWSPQTRSPAVADLLSLAGRVYLPFLLANQQAFEEGRTTFSMEVDGLPYAQGVFKYQVRCLQTLRASYVALPQAARTSLNPLLDQTGCLGALTG